MSQSRVVLTNGHTGHVSRAPGFFFLFDGPPTGCGEINRCADGIVADNGAINAANFLP